MPHVLPHIFVTHFVPSFAPYFILDSTPRFAPRFHFASCPKLCPMFFVTPSFALRIYNTTTVTPCLRHAHHPNFYPNPIFQLHNIVHIFTFVKQTKTKAEISLRQIKLSSFSILRIFYLNPALFQK